MITIGGLMQAITLPLIATAAVFIRYYRSDRRLAPGRAWDIFLWLSMLVLIVVGCYQAYQVITSISMSKFLGFFGF